MEEKSVTFTKGKTKIISGEGGEEADFSVENLDPFFQS